MVTQLQSLTPHGYWKIWKFFEKCLKNLKMKNMKNTEKCSLCPGRKPGQQGSRVCKCKENTWLMWFIEYILLYQYRDVLILTKLQNKNSIFLWKMFCSCVLLLISPNKIVFLKPKYKTHLLLFSEPLKMSIFTFFHTGHQTIKRPLM